MRKSHYMLLVLVIVFSMFLVACGGTAEEVADEADISAEEAAAIEEASEGEQAVEEAVEEEMAEEPAEEEMADGDKVQIRWFCCLGTGDDPAQIPVEEEVVADFNASQDEIELVLEVVPYEAARDALSTQIASGNGPDIIGPVGWGGSSDYYGQWMDIAPLIESSGFDTSIFDPELVKFYQTEEGQVGLPFAVFPGAMYFIPEMFDEAGLAYPPQTYGEQYELDGEMVDWNWDTVTEIAKRLTVDINGVNATEEGFDPAQIVQIGYEPQYQSTTSVGTFYSGAEKLYTGEEGSYEIVIPDSWKDAWKWWYAGMYGEQPYIATGPLVGSPEWGEGNPINTGKSAMALTQTWMTCCLGDLRDSGVEFQMGIQPLGTDGEVNGRIDADTFRMWIGSPHPEEAFEVMSYLITTGGDKLLPLYGAMPAIAEKTDAFFEVKSQDYPFVTDESWDIFVQGLAYPDIPSSEQYLPNSVEAYARFNTFKDLLLNTEDLDIDAEIVKLEEDLNVILNK